MLQGALTLAFVLISTILGLIIVLKYNKYKQRELLMVGITWILLVSGYWPDAITFIMVLLTGNVLEDGIYFFLANAFIPPIYITWSIPFSDLLIEKERDKKILIILMTIVAIIFEIIFLSLLFIDLSLIGTRMAPFYVKWTDFVVFFLLFSIVIFLVMGILFVRKSLKSKDKLIRSHINEMNIIANSVRIKENELEELRKKLKLKDEE